MGKQNYYFTFMQKQEGLKNGYVKIYGTFGGAREKMVSLFGDKWAFQYTEEQFLPQINRFHLSRIADLEEEKSDER